MLTAASSALNNKEKKLSLPVVISRGARKRRSPNWVVIYVSPTGEREGGSFSTLSNRRVVTRLGFALILFEVPILQ